MAEDGDKERGEINWKDAPDDPTEGCEPYRAEPPAWEPLREHDVAWAVRRLPRAVREACEAERRAGRPAPVIAGGYLRATVAREELRDIDVFLGDPGRADLLVHALGGGTPVLPDQAAGTPGEVVRTDFADTLRLPGGTLVQVIHRWAFARPEDVLAHFDFTVARACIFPSGGGWAGLCDPDFYADLAARRLVYTRPAEAEAEPGGSLLRVVKFSGRGYIPTLRTLAEIVAATAVQARPGIEGEGLADDVLYKLYEVDPAGDPGGWTR